MKKNKAKDGDEDLKNLSNLKAQLSTSSNNANIAQIEDEIHKIKNKKRDLRRAYLSTLSTRFNPDILVGFSDLVKDGKGITFIRGDEYFSKQKDETKEKETDSCNDQADNQTEAAAELNKKQVHQSEDEDETEGDAFDKLKSAKGQRYFCDSNPTIKCHNCKQFGHM